MGEVKKTRASHNGALRKTVGGLSAKYRAMAEIYRYFGRHWAHCLDFSDQAMVDHCNYISYEGKIDPFVNGFYHGMKWAEVNVAMWKEDMAKGELGRAELYADPNLPGWWLDKVL